jgi:hypothetical protein
MPKCKICKEPFVKIRPIQPTCKNYDCMVAFAKNVAEKAITKKKNAQTKVLKEKIKTLSDYLKELQVVFNKYICLRDKGNPCISCNATNYTVSCGHYFPSGKYKSVTFDEDNCHSQCWYNCNSKLSGNLIEYRVGLIKKIGLERLQLLEKRARQHKQWTKHEIQELIIIYKQKIKELKTNLNKQI